MVLFPMRDFRRVRVERERRAFERLVVRALDGLPDDIHRMLDNVEIVVDDGPTADHLRAEDSTEDTLFGLYEGVPLAERGSGYTLTVPDKITVFRGPLERAFENRAELVQQVRITVIHELAHHLGIDEERLDDLGLG